MAEGSVSQTTAPTLIRAEAFELVDPAGKVIASLSMFEGGPCLSLRGSDGREELRVIAGGSGGPAVMLFDHRDPPGTRQSRVSLGCPENGSGAQLSFSDRSGQTRLQICVVSEEQDRPRICFVDRFGQGIANWQPEVPPPSPVLAGELTAALMDLARLGQEADFRWLAQSQGVPESELDNLWNGTVRRIRRWSPRKAAQPATTQAVT